MLRHATYKRNEKDFATKVVEDDATGRVTLYVDDKAAVTSETDPVTGGNRFIESLVRNPDAIIEGGITRNADGAVTSADVVFPDGNTGTYTALVLSSDFPGAVDSYSITYGDQTYTQPTVTRNADGAVIDRPELEVA